MSVCSFDDYFPCCDCCKRRQTRSFPFTAALGLLVWILKASFSHTAAPPTVPVLEVKEEEKKWREATPTAMVIEARNDI